MKKLLLSILLVLTMLALVACGGDGGTNQPERPSGGDGYIYKDGSELYIVRNDPKMSFDEMNVLADGLRTQGAFVTMIGDNEAEKPHEIVLGETSRPISATAYALLEEMSLETNYVGYVIYSDGDSVAIAYDDGVAGITAISYFLENYATDKTLTMKKNFYYSDEVSLIDYYKALDIEKQNAAWDRLEADIGKEFADSMKYLYSIYNPDVVVWLARLYDPGVGGFYFSNSGRDTPGFLPDIESTQQALGFTKSNGMTDKDWQYIHPSDMLEEIGNFIYNLQAEDGYFYHPQWGTKITLNRRGRDYDRALGILSALGIKPKYKTANENISGGTAAVLTGRLGASAAYAVSSVVVVESTANIPEHLKSEEAFLEYLEGLNIYNNSYAPGNQIGAQSSQIIAAGLMDECAEYLASIQNPENGLWDDDSDYLAVNGLLKLSGLFKAGGMVFPNAEKAARAAMAAITSDEEMDAVTDLYNTWYAFDNIMINLRHFGQGELADKLIAELRLLAPEAIRVSADKINAFQKPDGSFSYGRRYSSTTSQGASVAVPNTEEGDVNATVISFNGIYGRIFEALELDSYKVPLFGHSDLLRYLAELDSLLPVEKETKLPDPEYVTFEDEDVGNTTTTAVDITSWKSTGAATIVADPRGGKALEIKSNNDGGDYIQLMNISGLPASCYVFESDFCVTEANANDYFAQITLYNCYMFTFTADAKGENIIIEDKSSTKWTTCYTNDFGVRIPVGQWFNVRVEYYPGDHDSVRIKFYVDDKLVAITDNYFDSTGTKLTAKGTPGDKYTMARIYLMQSSAVTMLMDNASAYKTADVYAFEEITVEGGVNVDADGGKEEKPENGENGAAILTFEGSETGNLPSAVMQNLVTDGSAVTVETVNRDGTDTKVLALDTNPDGNDRVAFGTMAKADGYNCIAFEADICFKDFALPSSKTTPIFQLFMGDAFMLNVVLDAEGNITLENPSSPTWSTSKVYDIGKVSTLGEWFKLRIEFYPGDADNLRFHIYLGGELIAVSNNYRGNFKENPEAPKTDANDFTVYAIKASDGVVMLDNVTMTKIVKSHGDLPVTTVTPK